MKIGLVIIAVMTLAAAGLLVAAQRFAVTRLGYELGRLEREEQAQREQRRRLHAELSALRGYHEVVRLVKEYGLPLDPPGTSSESLSGSAGGGAARSGKEVVASRR